MVSAKLFSCVIIIVFLFITCTEQREKNKIKNYVNFWQNKVLNLPISPDTLSYSVTSSSINNNQVYPFNYIIYIDSTECSQCDLQLFRWKQLVIIRDSMFRNLLDFKFHINTQEKDEIYYLMEEEEFPISFYIDKNKEFAAITQ